MGYRDTDHARKLGLLEREAEEQTTLTELQIRRARRRAGRPIINLDQLIAQTPTPVELANLRVQYDLFSPMPRAMKLDPRADS